MLTGKGQIRKEILHTLHNQSREEALRKSRIITKKLFSLPEFKSARFVMLYASRPEEVNTDELIDEALKMGKRVALPRCSSQETIIPKEINDRNKDLETGTHGIREPKNSRRSVKPDTLEAIVVPGVAFDTRNVRLGRGKGYYDRFLKACPHDIPRIGLAFDFQIVKNLPKDSHDIPISHIITN